MLRNPRAPSAEEAHEVVASCIGAHTDDCLRQEQPKRLISRCLARDGAVRGNHVVTVATEHAGVERVESIRSECDDCSVDSRGHVSVEEILNAITPDGAGITHDGE